jgi:RNA polymerase sigma-70 factor (ECF subfamily)
MATLGKMLNEHRPRLLVMLGRRIDPALAVRIDPEEVLSETFLEARRKWPWFKTQCTLSPYTWLYRIARDCLIEAWRRESRGRRDLRRDLPLPEQSSIGMGLALVDAGTSPISRAAKEELKQLVRQALAALRPADRELLWMRHFDELPFADIAAILGVTRNAATVRYVRALEKLRVLWLELHRGD